MTEFESSLLEELKNIRIALNRIVGNDPQKIVKDSSNTSTSSTVTTYMEEKPNVDSVSVKRIYFGTPDGCGFDECNALNDAESPKVLYVVETVDGKNGRFYPLNKGWARLRSNASSFLLPLCELESSIEAISNLNISAADYGEVVLDSGTWNVIRKCIIK